MGVEDIQAAVPEVGKRNSRIRTEITTDTIFPDIFHLRLWVVSFGKYLYYQFNKK
jgi:hypothetical protein